MTGFLWTEVELVSSNAVLEVVLEGCPNHEVEKNHNYKMQLFISSMAYKRREWKVVIWKDG